MIKHSLLMSALIAFLSLANTAYADFLIHADGTNACTTLPGSWNGEGTLSHWFIGQCVYKGIGTISQVDNTGNFTLDLSANKHSASFLCPGQISPQLSGTCTNGNVKVRSEYGELTGNFTNNIGQASGKLNLPGGVEADTVIRFSRLH